jgi:oxaloacetate decarboxylase alpha subunit
VYTVKVDGQSYVVEVAEGGDVSAINPVAAPPAAAVASPSPSALHPLSAPLAGNIFHVNVIVGDQVEAGDVIVVLEAMKMETEVRAQRSGKVAEVMVKVGDKVAVGDPLISVA